jgi:hypothetical protein
MPRLPFVDYAPEGLYLRLLRKITSRGLVVTEVFETIYLGAQLNVEIARALSLLFLWQGLLSSAPVRKFSGELKEFAEFSIGRTAASWSWAMAAENRKAPHRKRGLSAVR